jgi:DNA-binding transcriptional ArsR family regulator
MSEELPGVVDAVTTSDLVLQAFAEPNRRTMLELVAANEMPSGKIAEHFNVTRQAVSQHLRVLKEAGLVEERRVGRQRLYRARAEGIAVLHRYLNDLWSSSLALAKDIAEKAAEEASHGDDGELS